MDLQLTNREVMYNQEGGSPPLLFNQFPLERMSW